MQNAETKNVDGAIDKLLDRLITVIGDEAALFETFLELLERQQQALIDGQADELKTVTAQLQVIVSESQKLERQRIDAVEEIRRVGGTDTDLTVSRICEIADSERSGQLRNFRAMILDLYGRIEETRMRNGLLIQQSLEQIRNTIDTIGRIPATKEIYLKHGGISKDFERLGVDRRV